MSRALIGLCLCLFPLIGVSCRVLPEKFQSEDRPEQIPDIQEVRKTWLKGNVRKTFRQARKIVKYSENEAERGEAWLRIAQVQKLYDRETHALEAVNKGLKHDVTPKIEAALYHIQGQLNKQLDNREDALKSFQSARNVIQKHPDADQWVDHPFLLLQLGHLHVRTSNFQKGKEIWYEILERFPNSSVVEKVNKKLAFFQTYFAVQAGAFDNQQNAKELQSKLDNNGFDTYLKKVQSGDQLYHCVRIGQFSTYKEAQKMGKRIRPHVKKYFIIP